MEELIQNAINTLLAYPEAPLILGLVSLVFLVSFIFVTRELTGWYFKTSKILSQNQRLEDELRTVNQQLENLTEQMHTILLNNGSNGSADKALSEVAVDQPSSSVKKKEKGFPLSH